MKLINLDELKADIRFRCSECALNGTKYCREQCTVNNIIEVIDSQSVIAITDRPLAIINDTLIYMTEGHVKALLEYEHKQAVQIAVDNLKRDIFAVQEWENEHGKK